MILYSGINLGNNIQIVLLLLIIVKTFHLSPSMRHRVHTFLVNSKNCTDVSDNCPTQYKSTFTFARMKILAMKYEINIFWFYGGLDLGTDMAS